MRVLFYPSFNLQQQPTSKLRVCRRALCASSHVRVRCAQLRMYESIIDSQLCMLVFYFSFSLLFGCESADVLSYVNVCIYLCVRVYVCIMRTCVCVRISMRACVCVRISMRACVYIYACVCMCAYIYACVCMCAYIYAYVCMCAYIYAYVSMCAYI